MPPDAAILAFDTSAAHCAAALLLNGTIAASRCESMQKGQAERLFPLLEDMLSEAAISWRDLTALAVGIGPGNFTGVRIAVSAARGLALSLNIPAHGISTFEAQALDLPRPCLSLIDARQGKLYLQRFGAQPEAPTQADLATLPESLFLPGLSVCGDHATEVAARLGAQARPPAHPLAQAMALIAANRPAPAHRPAPLYLRSADAAPARESAPTILP